MNQRKWYILIFLIIIYNTVSAQKDEIDSLKNLLPFALEDSAKVDLLNTIGYSLFTSEPDSAIDYGNKAMILAKKIDYVSGIAYAFKNIGLGNYMKGNFLDVLEYWEKSLDAFKSINDKLGVANILNNLGAIYYNQGDDAKAIDYYLKSLRTSEELQDTLRIATALINIGGVYYNKPATHDKAMDYYMRAIPLSESIGDNGAIGTASINIGEIYLEKNKDSTALYYFNKSLKAWDGTSRVPYSLTRIGDVYAKNGEYKKAIEYREKAIAISRQYDAKLELIRPLLSLAETYRLTGRNNLALENFNEAKSIATEIGSNYELKDAYQGITLTYVNLKDYMNAYKYQKLLLELKDTLFNIETDDKIKGLQFTYEIDKKQGEIDLLTKDKELQEAEMEKQRLVKNAILAGLILILIIAFIIFRNYLAKVKINKILDNQKAEIENLLLNILPRKIANELKLNGKATPRKFDSVSVLFSDFKDFTKISAQLTPDDLVAELNDYFMAFDSIMEKYNLEKIKTIGDAYMCAGGLPGVNTTHPFDTINAAFEMLEFMEEKKKSRKADNKIPWEIRIGIHSGPIMAGVVGRKKYAYDIWGSTVNVASRMESNGQAGKINISEATFNLVRDNYHFHHRGKIMAKNVGEIDMYFVEKINTAAV